MEWRFFRGGEIIVLEFRFVGQKPHFWCAQNAKTCTFVQISFCQKKLSVTQQQIISFFSKLNIKCQMKKIFLTTKLQSYCAKSLFEFMVNSLENFEITTFSNRPTAKIWTSIPRYASNSDLTEHNHILSPNIPQTPNFTSNVL